MQPICENTPPQIPESWNFSNSTANASIDNYKSHLKSNLNKPKVKLDDKLIGKYYDDYFTLSQISKMQACYQVSKSRAYYNYLKNFCCYICCYVCCIWCFRKKGNSSNSYDLKEGKINPENDKRDSDIYLSVAKDIINADDERMHAISNFLQIPITLLQGMKTASKKNIHMLNHLLTKMLTSKKHKNSTSKFFEPTKNNQRAHSLDAAICLNKPKTQSLSSCSTNSSMGSNNSSSNQVSLQMRICSLNDHNSSQDENGQNSSQDDEYLDLQ